MAKSLSGFHYEQLTAENKAQGIPQMQVEEVYMTLQGSAIRYRYDGLLPDYVTGHLLYDGMSLRLTSIGQIEKFRFIATDDKPSILSITYERT